MKINARPYPESKKVAPYLKACSPTLRPTENKAISKAISNSQPQVCVETPNHGPITKTNTAKVLNVF